MGVRAGQLRHRVTIQYYNSGGRDDDGFDLPSGWVLLSKLWAKVTPLSSKDLISAQGEQSEVTARMMIRYNTDIDTGMRVIWKDRVFAIDSQGLDDADTGLEYTTFNLSGGIEKFKDEDSSFTQFFGLVDRRPLLSSIEKLVNEDLPEAIGGL